ncbi:PAS domain S-box protein [Salinadaptatus halalkaliphilus]|uniref:histidine kinase n=1 Tax=Salinadaptatus halalkaliphilus TaxID=2419781 RepID=A0A4S3TJG1_9EURY|nr:PAS domain S-box protein [Salinadaptatus halalkaliphilus]THE63035.1 PAS domain S-box protein [Salinadaptatus halalkaliphilus]
MSRPRVLCVSNDRATRAAVTLSLTDVPVDVVIAQDSSRAVERLETEGIDAVVIDASTVATVPTVVDAVDTQAPDIPTFVHWGEDGDSVAVLSEVVARSDETESRTRLTDAITDRIVTGIDTALQSGSEPVTGDSEPRIADAPDDLEELLERVRYRLVDARSPIVVERVIREECQRIDRFSFAWVGEYDRGEREIVPWLTDPTATDWPLQRTFGVGSGEQPLFEQALQRGELQLLEDVGANRDAVPLADHALEADVESVAVAPLASAEDRYGVLVVYTRDTLSMADQAVIRSLADTASSVLETIAVRGRLAHRERALNRYERLVETAGDGMYVLDDQGHFTTVNDALVEMTGYTRAGLLGEHASILFDEADVTAGRTTIRSLLEDGDQTDTVEMTLETKTGDRIPSEAQIAILVDDGEFLGSVGVVRDITERKRSERKLREQNERLDAFARIVSHDLRNPLGVSQGYLDLVEETGSIDHVDQVRDGLDRMESIIDDVLAIARDGEWAADTETVALEDIAADAWEHVSTETAALSIDTQATIVADRSRLLRLLENLFRNSVEHGSTSSRPQADDSVEDDGIAVTIRVGSFDAPDRHGFYVEDDGTGLPADIRDDLFDPSVSSGTDGLGIGLWIVREVATGHGWSVTASESENGGARFEFDFDEE